MGAERGPAMDIKVTVDSLTSTLSPNHEDAEPKLDASPEEIKSILEVIAATGKFWHDWDVLKNILSFQLKQVLAEYPEARIVNSTELQQSNLSGETYPELVKRLDEDSSKSSKHISQSFQACFCAGEEFTGDLNPHQMH